MSLLEAVAWIEYILLLPIPHGQLESKLLRGRVDIPVSSHAAVTPVYALERGQSYYWALLRATSEAGGFCSFLLLGNQLQRIGISHKGSGTERRER